MLSTPNMGGLPNPESNAEFYRDVLAKRLVAFVIDAVIVTALTFAALILSLFLLWWAIPLLAFAISVAYRTLCLRHYSATLGMRFVGIEIRDGNGDRVDNTTALYHSAIFSALFIVPILPVIGIITMLVTPYGQGLHDMPLGTTAIRRPN